MTNQNTPPTTETFSGTLNTDPNMQYTSSGRPATLLIVTPKGSFTGYRCIGFDEVAEQLNDSLNAGDIVWLRVQWGRNKKDPNTWEALITNWRLISQGASEGQETPSPEIEAPPQETALSQRIPPPPSDETQIERAEGTGEIVSPH